MRSASRAGGRVRAGGLSGRRRCWRAAIGPGRCIRHGNASVLHPCCIRFASVLHPCCTLVTLLLHPLCTVVAHLLHPCCTPVAPLLYRCCTPVAPRCALLCPCCNLVASLMQPCCTPGAPPPPSPPVLKRRSQRDPARPGARPGGPRPGPGPDSDLAAASRDPPGLLVGGPGTRPCAVTVPGTPRAPGRGPATVLSAAPAVLDDARQIHGPEIITIWPVDDTAIQLGESCGRCEAEVAGDSLSKTVFPEFECSRRHQTGPFGILRLVGTCLIRGLFLLVRTEE